MNYFIIFYFVLIWVKKHFNVSKCQYLIDLSMFRSELIAVFNEVGLNELDGRRAARLSALRCRRSWEIRCCLRPFWLTPVTSTSSIDRVCLPDGVPICRYLDSFQLDNIDYYWLLFKIVLNLIILVNSIESNDWNDIILINSIR